MTPIYTIEYATMFIPKSHFEAQKLKQRIYFVFKILVSVGLLIYLILMVDWGRTVNILASINLWSLLFIPIITLAGFVFASLRWKSLLRDNNIEFSFKDCFWGYWIGLFYSIFLPGVIGGDIIRAGLVVNKKKCSVISSATIVLMERIIGIIVLFLTMSIIMVIIPNTIDDLISAANSALLKIVALTILIGLGIVLISRTYLPKLLLRFRQNKITQFIYKPLLTLSLISNETLAKGMFFSFLFEAADIFTVYFLAQALGFDLPLLFFFAIMPIVYVITILPISLGGLGIREGVLVFFLSQTGVQASDAVTLSFMIYLNRIIIGGIAGLIQLFKSMMKTPN